MGTLFAEAAAWTDSEGCARDIRDRFTQYVDDDPGLLAHRIFIEDHAYGMGERCFHWLWKLAVDEMPTFFRFLEVGVYKGQVLSLVKLLAKRTGKFAGVVGVTLLNSFAGDTDEFPPYPDEDYEKYIIHLHERFDLVQPRLVVGDSAAQATQQAAAKHGPYDLVYIDGGHEYDYVMKDLMAYPNLIKPGGFLVVDDCSNYLKMPFGFFQGIEPVSRAVRTIIETDPQWTHLLAVVHNQVWQRRQA